MAKPYLRADHKISGDYDIDASGGRFEADINIVGTEHQPPVAWAAIGFGNAAKIEADDETFSRYFCSIDLPAHAPDERLGVNIVRTDQALSPALAPSA